MWIETWIQFQQRQLVGIDLRRPRNHFMKIKSIMTNRFDFRRTGGSNNCSKHMFMFNGIHSFSVRLSSTVSTIITICTSTVDRCNSMPNGNSRTSVRSVQRETLRFLTGIGLMQFLFRFFPFALTSTGRKFVQIGCSIQMVASTVTNTACDAHSSVGEKKLFLQ